MSRPRSPFLKLAERIGGGERVGIVARWEYGRELLKARAGRERLPKGYLAARIAEADQAGLKPLAVSERELQRWMRFAEVYPTEAHRRQILSLKGTWSAIIEADFPAVEIDEIQSPTTGLDVDHDDLEAIGEPDLYTEQPLFDIPGFKPVLKIRGRKVDLAEATVREAVDYRDMCREMHANFGRTVAQVDASVQIMLDGCGGDLDANAVKAWQRATGEPETDAESVQDAA